MDFSTSGNNDENEYYSEKDLIINKSREEEKMKIITINIA